MSERDKWMNAKIHSIIEQVNELSDEQAFLEWKAEKHKLLETTSIFGLGNKPQEETKPEQKED